MLLVHLFAEPAHAFGRHFGGDLDQLWRELIYILRHPPQVVIIAAYIAGGLCLVFGWRIYQFIVMLPGILIGGLIGFALGALQWGEIGGLFIALLGAGLGGGLAWALHQIVIWLVGAIGGGIIVFAVSEAAFHTEPHGLVLLIGAVIGGSLLLLLAKAFIVVKASFIGALLIAYGAGELANPVVWIALTLVGTAIQFGLARLMGEKVSLPRFGRGSEGTGPPRIESKKEVPSPSIRKPEPARLSSPEWRIAIYQDGSHVATHDLASGIYSLGREDGVHFRIEDAAISRRHLEITVSDKGEILLQDLGSANGTWKSGDERVTEDTPECGSWYQMGTAQVMFQRG
jgi:hypothetical protein